MELHQVVDIFFEGRLKVHGELHLETLGTIQWLSRIGLEEKRFDEAETWSKRALEGYQKLQGEKSTEIYNTKYWMGRLRYDEGRYDDAECILKEALTGYRVEKHRNDITATLFWLGKCSSENKRYEDAERIWKEELDERRAGTSKPDKLMARTLLHLSRLYRLLERWEETKKAAEEVLSIQQNLPKPDTADISEATELIKLVDSTTVCGPRVDGEETSGQVPVPVTPVPLVETESDDQRMEASPIQAESEGHDPDGEALPDPGGDPRASSEFLMMPTPLSPPRPRSPFDLRSQFGTQPNSWSMF
jgi:tetratricopeptide (TPR) repeat protein